MIYPHRNAPNGIPVGAVILTEVQIPFWDLVMLLVKIAVAAIPASIIVFIVYGLIWAFLYSLLGVGAWTAFHR